MAGQIHKKDKLTEVSPNLQEESSSNMSDFKPLPEFNPVQAVRPNQYTSNIARNEKVDLQEKVNNYNENYYANVGYQNESIIDKNKDLLHKLNYIITLLEEQRDEKTNYVMEEVILYTFLGIFIIFIIDSFAKASKYVR